jgi:hypothetical protein
VIDINLLSTRKHYYSNSQNPRLCKNKAFLGSGATEESRKSHKDWILSYAQYDRRIILMLFTQSLRFRNEIRRKVKIHIVHMNANWYKIIPHFIRINIAIETMYEIFRLSLEY